MTPEIKVTRIGDLCLTRTEPDSIRISWRIAGQILKIIVFSRLSADETKHHFTVARLRDRASVTVSGLDPDTRYYFETVSESGLRTIISERRIFWNKKERCRKRHLPLVRSKI